MSEQDDQQPHAPETEAAPTAEVAPETEATAALGADLAVERPIHQMSRRSLLWGAVAIASVHSSWRWLITRRLDEGVPRPPRRTLEVNEQLARDYFGPSRLAPTFPRERAGPPRENDDEGLSDDFDPATWSLYLVGAKEEEHATATDPATGESALKLTLAQIRALPRVEIVTELNCIEGWSRVVHWAGARFADFAARYPPAPREDGEENGKPDDPANWPGYVSLVTPDAGYYVGLDMASAMHPQTLLCYDLSWVFRVDDRKALGRCDNQRRLIRADEVIEQTPVPEIQRNSELQGIQGTQAPSDTVLPDQTLSSLVMEACHSCHMELTPRHIGEEAAPQNLKVRFRDDAHPHLACEDRLRLNDGEARDEMQGFWLVDQPVYFRAPDLRVVVLSQRTRVQKVASHLLLVALRDEICG